MSAVAEERTGVAWIVCFGDFLLADDGFVTCPLGDRTVRVATCLDCRYLAAVADERSPDRDCLVPTSIG